LGNIKSKRNHREGVENEPSRYSQYFNRKIEKKGHLWQGRFYSCTLDKSHTLSAIKYIERNPVRANNGRKGI